MTAPAFAIDLGHDQIASDQPDFNARIAAGVAGIPLSPRFRTGGISAKCDSPRRPSMSRMTLEVQPVSSRLRRAASTRRERHPN